MTCAEMLKTKIYNIRSSPPEGKVFRKREFKCLAFVWQKYLEGCAIHTPYAQARKMQTQPRNTAKKQLLIFIAGEITELDWHLCWIVAAIHWNLEQEAKQRILENRLNLDKSTIEIVLIQKVLGLQLLPKL